MNAADANYEIVYRHRGWKQEWIVSRLILMCSRIDSHTHLWAAWWPRLASVGRPRLWKKGLILLLYLI